MSIGVDFSSCARVYIKIYGGGNGTKIGLLYSGNNYMVKFPLKAKPETKLNYTNSCVSEYVGCHVYETLGIDVQQTILGEYNGKQVVACLDFENNGFILKDFAFLKNSILDSGDKGYDTELNDILFAIDNQRIMPKDKILSFFWNVFIVDTLLGNFDRHNGNWSFLINYSTNEIKLAPVYDCGSCLYPQLADSVMSRILSTREEIDKRLFQFPNSAIRQNGVKMNYYNFLMTTDNKDCLKALKDIGSKINLQKINIIIEETPYISDVYKTFLKTIIRERKEKIIDAAIDKHHLYPEICNSSQF